MWKPRQNTKTEMQKKYKTHTVWLLKKRSLRYIDVPPGHLHEGNKEIKNQNSDEDKPIGERDLERGE